jgi:hypothetical protein
MNEPVKTFVLCETESGKVKVTVTVCAGVTAEEVFAALSKAREDARAALN